MIFQSLKDVSFRGITIIYFLITVGFTVMTTAFVLYTEERFGYDAHANGWLFLFIGALAVGLQGGVFARLSKQFGEPNLTIAGTVLLTLSLFAVPFVGPASGAGGTAHRHHVLFDRELDRVARTHEPCFQERSRTRTRQSARHYAVGCEPCKGDRTGRGRLLTQ
ncbi:MAG: arabinose efflux permease [Acidobacteria bacterium OLB17]|nr:MAG: arabinose efflux permease [Acidobacteria bacterium OLB17]